MSLVRDENYREAHLHPCISMDASCTVVFWGMQKNEIKGKMNFRLFCCMEVSTLFSRQRSVLHKITSERHPRLSACVDGRKKRGANGFELPLTRNFTQLPSHPSRRRPMWWDPTIVHWVWEEKITREWNIWCTKQQWFEVKVDNGNQMWSFPSFSLFYPKLC